MPQCFRELAPSPGDVWALFHSYAFDYSVWEIFGALTSGGSLWIVPQALTRTPDAFVAEARVAASRS